MSEQIYRANVSKDGIARLEIKFINPPERVFSAALRGYLKKGWHMFRALAEMEVEKINREKDLTPNAD